MMKHRSVALFAVALVALALLVAAAILWPRTAAAGWLIAYIYVSAVPLGSLALLPIHRLTGGRWGDALRPVLEPAAACIPLLALLFIPVLIGLALLYPWVTQTGTVKADVGTFYLNSPLFIARAVAAFAGWSTLALIVPRVRGRSGTLLAGIGLIFHAVAVSLIAIDWILSAEPASISTSFGASVVITQMLAALAFAALAAPPRERQALRDLAGLMLAVALGLTYIDFMAVLVIWYGDVPDKIEWLVARTHTPWPFFAIFAFAFASVIPILALLLARVRASRRAVRLVGASVLAGIAFYDAYLLAPAYDAWALATAALALVAMCGLLIAAAALGWPARFQRMRIAHG
jgi:hypothetical protein